MIFATKNTCQVVCGERVKCSMIAHKEKMKKSLGIMSL